MPRLPPSLFRRARYEDPLLAKLLPTCRSLPSARNELRWLRQHVHAVASAQCKHPTGREVGRRVDLDSLVAQRARGTPLQYILGSEFFGDLEIICRPGVLIPRPDTANAIIYLAHRIARRLPLNAHQGLRVLDLCTGSGCIPLLFHHEINKLVDLGSNLNLLGIDVSEKALALAQLNKARQLEHYTGITVANSSGGNCSTALESLANIEFTRGDVLNSSDLVTKLKANNSPSWDVLVSNPPYISQWALDHLTEPSVRKYEPLLALVPPAIQTVDGISQADDLGDTFYNPLIDTARMVDAKVAWFEVADIEQARRVAMTIASSTSASPANIEIWRDQLPRFWDDADIQPKEDLYDGFRVIGTGNGRSVAWWRL